MDSVCAVRLSWLQEAQKIRSPRYWIHVWRVTLEVSYSRLLLKKFIWYSRQTWVTRDPVFDVVSIHLGEIETLGRNSSSAPNQNSGRISFRPFFRRWKTYDWTLDAPKVKSRRCVHGHLGPDFPWLKILQFHVVDRNVKRVRSTLRRVTILDWAITISLDWTWTSVDGTTSSEEFRVTPTSYLIQIWFVKFLMDPCSWLYRLSSKEFEPLRTTSHLQIKRDSSVNGEIHFWGAPSSDALQNTTRMLFVPCQRKGSWCFERLIRDFRNSEYVRIQTFSSYESGCTVSERRDLVSTSLSKSDQC